MMLFSQLKMKIRAFFERKAFVMRPNNDDRSLSDLVSVGLTGRNNVGIEIGCYAGESTFHFLATGKFSTFYCIDPWSTGYDKNDFASYTNQFAEKVFDEKVARHKEVIKIKDYSQNVDHLFIDDSVDFVYIDGEHTYEGVLRDLEKYFSKVKIGGVIAGHDYVDGWPGVVKAVNEFFKTPPHNKYADGSWMYFKNRLVN